MKKVLILLAICALAVPAFAGEVTFTAVPDGADVNIVMTVVADEGDGPVGIGLDVAVNAGADLTAAVMVNPFFDIFIDEAYDMETATPGSYTYGAGAGPVCLVAAPGATTVAAAMADSRVFAICAGGLGGATGTPAAPPTGEVILAKLSGAEGATATVTANAIRGGAVVFKSGAEVTVNGLPLDIIIPAGGEGLNPGDVIGGVTVTQAHYDLWVTLGKPVVWTTEGNWMGDGDGDGFVNGDDVTPIINYFGQATTSETAAYDLNKDGFINGDDVVPIINNFGANPGI